MLIFPPMRDVLVRAFISPIHLLNTMPLRTTTSKHLKCYTPIRDATAHIPHAPVRLGKWGLGISLSRPILRLGGNTAFRGPRRYMSNVWTTLWIQLVRFYRIVPKLELLDNVLHCTRVQVRRTYIDSKCPSCIFMDAEPSI